ncbi:MAG: FHA domain-containing protein [Planctomycetaceae bacterium]
MHAQLIPNDGSAPITLRRDITLVGRKTGLCDLIIDRSSISKIHCILVKTDGLLFVRDLGSTNGTRVNGQRVTRGALLPGDVLSFSSVKYKVHLGPDLPEDVGVVDESAEPTEMIRLFDDPPEKFLDSDSSHSDVRILSDSDFLNDM